MGAAGRPNNDENLTFAQYAAKYGHMAAERLDYPKVEPQADYVIVPKQHDSFASPLDGILDVVQTGLGIAAPFNPAAAMGAAQFAAIRKLGDITTDALGGNQTSITPGRYETGTAKRSQASIEKDRVNDAITAREMRGVENIDFSKLKSVEQPAEQPVQQPVQPEEPVQQPVQPVQPKSIVTNAQPYQPPPPQEYNIPPEGPPKDTSYYDMHPQPLSHNFQQRFETAPIIVKPKRGTHKKVGKLIHPKKKKSNKK